MGKRKHGESANDDGADLAPSKRRASNSLDEADALQILRHNADELSDCLKSLEGSSGADMHKLASLSQKLLPAIQYLSGSNSVDKSTKSNKVSPTEESSVTQSSTPQSTALYIPPLDSLKAWTVSDIPKKRPPLPSISNPVLEKAALTHPAITVGLSGLNYEVLEFLGDSFIYHIASELVSQTFPKLTPGKCTQMREILVKNTTLAKYSEEYGLNRRAIFPDELLEGRVGGTKASQDKRTKTLGDIFEAYIGALIHSDPEGPAKAIAWLKPLWAMTIAEEIKRADRQNASIASRPPEVVAPNGQERSFKQQLSILISVPGVKIDYRAVPNKQKNANGLPLFSMTVHVEGWGAPEQFLAKGSGLSKKEAGEKAAEMALENKKAMKDLAAKKQEYMARKAALSI